MRIDSMSVESSRQREEGVDTCSASRRGETAEVRHHSNLVANYRISFVLHFDRSRLSDGLQWVPSSHRWPGE